MLFHMNIRSLGSLLVPSAGARAALFLIPALLGTSATAMGGSEILVADPNGTNGVSSYQMDGTLINSSLIPGTAFQDLALSGSTLYIGDPESGAASIRTATLNASGGVSSTGFFTIGGMANGLDSPFGLALTATDLYVANINTGFVFKYDLSSTLQVNGLSTNIVIGGNSFITSPYGLAISGNTLFVSSATTGNGANMINGYNLTTFSSTPTFTITTDLNIPLGLAVSGTTLYVANSGDGTIWSFDATTGTPIAQVVSGLTGPDGLLVSGNDLYVSGEDGTVKGFDVTTGDPLVGFTTITGLSDPNGIVIAPTSVPEPSTYAALAGVLALGLAGLSRRARKTA